MSAQSSNLGHYLEENRDYLEQQIRARADELVLAKESISDLMQSISRELLGENERFEYRGEAEFKAWLKRVVSSKVIDKHRFYTAQKRDQREERRLPTDGGAVSATPSRVAMREEERERVTRALECLSAEHQEVLRLFWFEGLAHAEIAKRMERQEPATRKLLSRAKAQLGLEIERLKREEN